LLRASKTIPISDLAQTCQDVISSRSLIRSAVGHPLWQKQDAAPVINRQRELIGVLWYSQLRDALSTTTTTRTASHTAESPVRDILHAHGESMRAMLDILFKVGI
jgi:hypothetical protein